MKRFVLIMLVFSILCAFCACANGTDSTSSEVSKSNSEVSSAVSETVSEEEQSAEETSSEVSQPTYLDKTKHYSILIIGNSYTYYNDMPDEIFAEIFKSAGYDVSVTAITKGGQYLLESADPADEVGKKVDEAFKNNKYDFVILQEQSARPAAKPDKYLEGVTKLLEKITENGATPIIYGTWGRKEGHETLTSKGWTNESMTWLLAASFENVGKELNIDVAHAGLAFFDVHTNNQAINLYNSDLTHPSEEGSYLAALTLFSTITGIDPTTVEFNFNLDGSVVSVLKEAARKAVFDTPVIPEEYLGK